MNLFLKSTEVVLLLFLHTTCVGKTYINRRRIIYGISIGQIETKFVRELYTIWFLEEIDSTLTDNIKKVTESDQRLLGG